MRVDLGSFTGMDAELRLPVPGDAPPHHLHLQKLSSLGGVLERADGTLRLSDVEASEVQLAAARWTFGTVELVSSKPCTLQQLQLELCVSDAPLQMQLGASSVDFGWLEVLVGDTRVRAQARLQGASLQLAESRGSLRAEVARLTDLEVQLGGVSIRVPALDVQGFEIGWGQPEGFRMAVRRALGDRVAVESGAASLQGGDVDLEGFEVAHGAVKALALSVQTWATEVAFESSGAQAQQRDAPATPPRRALDLDVLDALAGQLVADARFQLRLPGGLQRRLHIPLQLDVVDGSIDYRALEHSLPTFEDSLLDFSRDEDWLVLELGLPLLPTRGLGKQLLRWPLRSPDGTTRGGHQIRLAALPRFERPAPRGSRPAPSRESSPGKSPVRLETAKLQLGPMQLKLPPPSQHLDAAIELLSFDSARLQGELGYHHDGAPAGHLKAELDALEVRIADLAAGSKRLDLHLTAKRASDVRVEMAGMRPRSMLLEAESVRLSAVHYR